MSLENAGTSYERGLKELVESIPGALAASLTGLDGIGIASYQPKDLGSNQADPSLADAEFATMLTSVSRAAKNLEAGEVDELILATDRATYLLKLVGPDFFLALALAPGRSNLGLARLKLRWAAKAFGRMLL